MTYYSYAFHMKDGPEGDVIGSRPKRVELGGDEDGDPITSCVIVPIEISETRPIEGPRLTKNQQTMFSILHDAGCLTKEQWNETGARCASRDQPQGRSPRPAYRAASQAARIRDRERLSGETTVRNGYDGLRFRVSYIDTRNVT